MAQGKRVEVSAAHLINSGKWRKNEAGIGKPLVQTQRVFRPTHPYIWVALNLNGRAQRCSPCDCSRFCGCQILQIQHGSTTGGEPGIENKWLTNGHSG
jgi:hypothetical protein